MMRKTKVFKIGHSQAVRIPAEFQLNSNVVEIFRRDNELIIRDAPASLERAFHLLASLPQDFSVDRDDDLPRERKGLLQ